MLLRIRRLLDEAARGTFTGAELREAQAYLRGKRALACEGSAATALDLLQELSRPAAPDALSVTVAQLNDTARRLFRYGAPLALIAGPLPSSSGRAACAAPPASRLSGGSTAR